MEYGICQVSVAPIRKEPSDKSEMVSQLLFGELVCIISDQKNWIKITCFYDDYEGYIDYKHIINCSEEQFTLLNKEVVYSKATIDYIGYNNQLFHISIGSELRNYHDNIINLFYHNYTFNGEITKGILPKTQLIPIALSYINTPYLWGGKSSFGIDCSGFTQQVYKLVGYKIPRDSNEQAKIGEALSFIEESSAGDLAFFENEEGNIIHVGIILENNTIIHAHGKVRIDTLDSLGIYNAEYKKHTHRLRFIRKIIFK